MTPADRKEGAMPGIVLEPVLKLSKKPKEDTGKESNGLKEDGLFLISGSKSAVVFELEEEVFHQMALFIDVPVGMPWMLRGHSTGNDNNAAVFFHPPYKFITIIPFVCKNQLSFQIKWLQ